MTITLTIPLPPAGCAQNSRGHWRKGATANKIAKDEAFNVAMEARLRHGPFTKAVRVHHTWYMAKDAREGMRGVPKRYRPLDEGNAIGALKASIDGIVAAGLLPADSHDWLKWGDGILYRNAHAHQGQCCVILTLEEVQ